MTSRPSDGRRGGTRGGLESAAAHRLEQRMTIAAPRDEVWSLVEEPEALMQWVHGLKSVTSASGMPGGFALGATFVQRIRIGLIPTACRGEVVECVPPSRLAVVVHHSLLSSAPDLLSALPWLTCTSAPR